jgi:predicted PurR-regulated permease PerM
VRVERPANGVNRSDPLDWMRWIPALALAVCVIILIFIGGGVILVPLLVSLALAYILEPLVEWFERRGWSRSTAVLLTFLAAVLVTGLALLFLAPGFWHQLVKSYMQARLLTSDPTRIQILLAKLQHFSPPLYEYLSAMIDELKDPARQAQLRETSVGWLRSGLFRVVNITAPALDMVLVPFFVYYLLKGYRGIRGMIDRLVPPRHRPVVDRLLREINQVLSAYVRNQLLIALVMGCLYALGFAILRVPLALTIGLLSGLLNFVPYLGTVTGLVLSLTFVALDGAETWRLLGVLGVFALVQTIEGYVLTPRLLGSRLNLHPLWVLVAVVISGNLFGLLGVILAIPVLAACKVVLSFVEENYQQSSFYQRASRNLVTEGGTPVALATSYDVVPGAVVLAEEPERSRRVILTTTELRSRRPDLED